MKKKILSSLLAVCLFVGAAIPAVFAGYTSDLAGNAQKVTKITVLKEKYDIKEGESKDFSNEISVYENKSKLVIDLQQIRYTAVGDTNSFHVTTAGVVTAVKTGGTITLTIYDDQNKSARVDTVINSIPGAPANGNYATSFKFSDASRYEVVYDNKDTFYNNNDKKEEGFKVISSEGFSFSVNSIPSGTMFNDVNERNIIDKVIAEMNDELGLTPYLGTPISGAMSDSKKATATIDLSSILSRGIADGTAFVIGNQRINGSTATANNIGVSIDSIRKHLTNKDIVFNGVAYTYAATGDLAVGNVANKIVLVHKAGGIYTPVTADILGGINNNGDYLNTASGVKVTASVSPITAANAPTLLTTDITTPGKASIPAQVAQYTVDLAGATVGATVTSVFGATVTGGAHTITSNLTADATAIAGNLTINGFTFTTSGSKIIMTADAAGADATQAANTVNMVSANAAGAAPTSLATTIVTVGTNIVAADAAIYTVDLAGMGAGTTITSAFGTPVSVEYRTSETATATALKAALDAKGIAGYTVSTNTTKVLLTAAVAGLDTNVAARTVDMTVTGGAANVAAKRATITYSVAGLLANGIPNGRNFTIGDGSDAITVNGGTDTTTLTNAMAKIKTAIDGRFVLVDGVSYGIVVDNTTNVNTITLTQAADPIAGAAVVNPTNAKATAALTNDGKTVATIQNAIVIKDGADGSLQLYKGVTAAAVTGNKTEITFKVAKEELQDVKSPMSLNKNRAAEFTYQMMRQGGETGLNVTAKTNLFAVKAIPVEKIGFFTNDTIKVGEFKSYGVSYYPSNANVGKATGVKFAAYRRSDVNNNEKFEHAVITETGDDKVVIRGIDSNPDAGRTNAQNVIRATVTTRNNTVSVHDAVVTVVDQDYTAEGVRTPYLNTTTGAIKVGGQMVLSVKDTVAGTTVKWSIDNDNVSIDPATGLATTIRGKKVGTSEVTAVLSTGEAFKATITVSAADVVVTPDPTTPDPTPTTPTPGPSKNPQTGDTLFANIG